MVLDVALDRSFRGAMRIYFDLGDRGAEQIAVSLLDTDWDGRIAVKIIDDRSIGLLIAMEVK